MPKPRARRKLILASGSPRRKYLLRRAKIPFRVVRSSVREGHPRGMSPSRLVKRLALAKALSVSQKYPDDLVLGADTIVYIDGQFVGKPKNVADARRILKKLSGAWQRVYTGVALCREGGRKHKVDVAVSRVKIRPLNESDIERAARRHLDKAGAYAIQQKNDPFVEKIKGDFDNVVGLPLRVVRRLLRGRLLESFAEPLGGHLHF